MDFLPLLHLSTPTMKYPEENGDKWRPLGGSSKLRHCVSTSAITECSKQAKGKLTHQRPALSFLAQ